MKVIVYIQSTEKKINPISLESLVAAQKLRENKAAEVYAVTFSSDIANQLAVGYFYKFESGDTSTADQAESVWVRFFQSKWQRPQFSVKGAEY